MQSRRRAEHSPGLYARREADRANGTWLIGAGEASLGALAVAHGQADQAVFDLDVAVAAGFNDCVALHAAPFRPLGVDTIGRLDAGVSLLRQHQPQSHRRLVGPLPRRARRLVRLVRLVRRRPGFPAPAGCRGPSIVERPAAGTALLPCPPLGSITYPA
ncbi:hypothetical protein [Streptomyces exfoliatus]|uniref:hypothetical protein n=1 Tax=Streptomyces exfoliatus TaxID=1905 RepID=UPI0004B23A1A|nr:hypothetical protein [Streptomyces exfoliatus]